MADSIKLQTQHKEDMDQQEQKAALIEKQIESEKEITKLKEEEYDRKIVEAEKKVKLIG